MKYRTKVTEKEAFLYRGLAMARAELPDWFLKALGAEDIYREGDDLRIVTLEGIMTAKPGEYIIQGLQGEIYPCKAEIFEKSYEAVEPASG